MRSSIFRSGLFEDGSIRQGTFRDTRHFATGLGATFAIREVWAYSTAATGQHTAPATPVPTGATEFPMPSTVLTAVLLSPGYSKAVAGGITKARAEVARLTSEGILVFLTAADAESADAAIRWVREPEGFDGQARALLRLVTPGAYRWPKGEIRMPLDAALDDAGIQAVRTIVDEVLVQRSPTGTLVFDDAEGFFGVSAEGELPTDMV